MTSPFKRCLVLINTRSGTRDDRMLYALQEYMTTRGIVHEQVVAPGDDLLAALRARLPDKDVLVVCGDDGTVHQLANDLMVLQKELAKEARNSAAQGATCIRSTSCGGRLSPPLLVVPTGHLSNGIAHSLGINSAARAVGAFIAGHTVPVPLLAVRLNDTAVRYACGYAAVGCYTESLYRYYRLHAVGERAMVMPLLPCRFTIATAYSALRQRAMPCMTQIEVSDGVSPSTSRKVHESVRLLIASQMPCLHSSYSLTPTATFQEGKMGVTVATEAASPGRMLHLMLREAPERRVANEGGVHTYARVSQVSLGPPRGGPPHLSEDAFHVAIDGEVVSVPSGSRLTIRPSAFSLPFLA